MVIFHVVNLHFYTQQGHLHRKPPYLLRIGLISVSVTLANIWGCGFSYVLPVNTPSGTNFLFFFFYKFIYLWLHWIFVAARGLSLVMASGGYSSLRCAGFSLRWLLLWQSTGSRHAGLSSCGSRALEHRLSSCGA